MFPHGFFNQKGRNEDKIVDTKKFPDFAEILIGLVAWFERKMNGGISQMKNFMIF